MQNIIVVGGGFASIAAAKALQHNLAKDWQVVLVSNENYMTYTPLLPEVVGASLLPAHAVAPIRRMLPWGRYYQADVEQIDLAARCISFESGKPHTLFFEHLVFAFGKVPNTRFIEGLAEHALPLKTLGDALHIRNRVITALERAELEDDPDDRRRLMTFIVIGGGSSGVEVAGAIADFLTAASKYYSVLKNETAKIVMLESSERLLSEFTQSLGDSALRRIRKDGIEVRLNAQVSRITGEGVEITDEEWIEGSNVICTIGTLPNPFTQKLGLPETRGLIQTKPGLMVEGFENVWAIGDCAAVMNAKTGEYSPPTAQFAVQQGKQLAKNIVRVINGTSPRPFSFRSRGQVATIGHRKAIAHVLGIKMSGFPAWLLWRAIYLAMLPTMLRKLQVFSEWNLDLLFPRDITQLQLTRTQSEGIDSGQQQDQ